ncbi:MAG: S-methyl-5-thioribose-1-phosphate isomerase [Candidatus Omnitrophica bacterium]|nr:S-methyl-5-thioribose-1-phosphate isomerase [Candidatus Omnitrophota bacterium]MBU4487869.1 S-methyl-5-thioribose-1-phosphate isomerase [Candidatus Omnitrophota bacterium]MCG2704652.1 S-methyl-5-thioribose-1-phosphate isomerase [Candidatus Omnitrophota bacterium]
MQTIAWKNKKAVIIDQTKLPHKLAYLNIRDARTMWWAIKKLKIRGAPAIGVAGAFGVVLGTQNMRADKYGVFKRRLDEIIKYLVSCRPTAVNLAWALERMRRCAEKNKSDSVTKIKSTLLKEAVKIMEEDKICCRKMARHGAKFIKNGDSILTHCNAGGLATVDYGTALGVLFEAKKQGKKIKVFVDETRPLLQGARLTAWELLKAGIDTTLICDNMAASLMAKGKIDKIFVGADRIAQNGDVANKIGTYNLAVLAKYHKIPFYVVAPVSTIDLKLSSGKHIPIEERDEDEVRTVMTKRIAPKNVKAYNPAFDVTPARLITAIITESGVRPSLCKLR